MISVAIYCRQSRTREAVSASIADQRAELEALADRRGWTVAGVYEDANAPADDLDARDRWGDLLLDADAGNFEVVAAYDTSRLWRSVELRIATCRTLAASGVATVATLAGDTPTDGADDPEGELIGNVLAAVAQFDNKLRAKKTRASVKRAARAGAPWTGRRPFGYTPGRTAIVDAEAALIRSAVERVIRGEAVNAIVDDWNRAGIPTASGRGTWTRQTVIRMLRSPGIAGDRTYRGTRYPGTWPAIVGRDEHAQVVAALDAGKRPRGGPGTPRLLSSSGLSRCGKCRNTLRAATAPNGARQYKCHPVPGTTRCGGVAVMAEPFEAEVRDQVFAVLDPDVVDRFVRQAAEADGRVEAASATLASIAERRALVGRTLARHGDADVARAALDELDRLEAAARRDLQSTSSAIGVVLKASADPAGWWDAESTDMLDRRGLLEALIDHVTVLPGDPRSFEFDPERVKIRWRV